MSDPSDLSARFEDEVRSLDEWRRRMQLFHDEAAGLDPRPAGPAASLLSPSSRAASASPTAAVGRWRPGSTRSTASGMSGSSGTSRGLAGPTTRPR
jgi:hypothetical protein